MIDINSSGDGIETNCAIHVDQELHAHMTHHPWPFKLYCKYSFLMYKDHNVDVSIVQLGSWVRLWKSYRLVSSGCFKALLSTEEHKAICESIKPLTINEYALTLPIHVGIAIDKLANEKLPGNIQNNMHYT